MAELAVHDFGNLNLEGFKAAGGWGLATILIMMEAVNVQLALWDVSNVVVFEIENTFGVLNDGRGIRSDKEFDG